MEIKKTSDKYNHLLERREITTDSIYGELGQIINGTIPGRTDPYQITLFKSVGVAVQDAAVAWQALLAANEAGLGQMISL